MEMNSFHRQKIDRVRKSRTEINQQGVEIKGFHRLSISCSAEVLEKSRNLEKREKHPSGFSNPESLNGSPTDSDTDFKKK
jgi:hypothetical protein